MKRSIFTVIGCIFMIVIFMSCAAPEGSLKSGAVAAASASASVVAVAAAFACVVEVSAKVVAWEALVSAASAAV